MDYSSTEFLSKSLNEENTDHSVLVYQRDGAFILSASGLIYAPVVITLLILLTCACLQKVQNHTSETNPVPHTHSAVL